MTPHCYIRKSVVLKGHRLLSPEVQEAEGRKLAERYGHTEMVMLADIGRSGKDTKRPGYQALTDAIRAGRVSALYAYSLSRLNRSVADYSDLVSLCVEHRVPIRLVHEGEQDFSTASGRFTRTILAAAAQMQRELDSERQKDNIRVKREKGERHGEPSYGGYEWESVEAVVDAFSVAGSVNGAARQLDAWGIPSRRGGRWGTASVRRILHAQAPSVIPMGQSQRVKAAPRFRLARLLRCHCGRTLTAVNNRGQVRYRCHESIVAGHGKYSIAEDSILEWVKDEYGRLRLPGERFAEEAPSAERGRLTEQMDRLSRQHQMGLLSDAQLMERATEVQSALERVQSAEIVMTVDPAIDWDTDPPEAVNGVLRALWEYVELGPDLLPVRAEWRVPQWRAVHM
jgi:DNA invertase Pin-like site-specific DNA recombinase